MELVLAAEEHAHRLFLAVLAAQPPGAVAPADVIPGLAVLAVCFNSVYVARLLAIALIRAFRPAAAASSTAALLDSPTRWAVTDRTLQLVTGLLGVAIGTSAAGSGGASMLGSPRAAPRPPPFAGDGGPLGTPRAALPPRSPAGDAGPLAATPRQGSA